MKHGTGSKHFLIGALVPLVAVGLIVGGGFGIYYFGGDASTSNTPGVSIEKMHGSDTASITSIAFTDDYSETESLMFLVGQSRIDFPSKCKVTIGFNDDSAVDFYYYLDVKIELTGVFATYFTIDNTLIADKSASPFTYNSDYSVGTGTFAKIEGDKAAATSSKTAELSTIGFSYRSGKMPQSNEQYAVVKKTIEEAPKGEENQIKFTFSLRAEIK